MEKKVTSIPPLLKALLDLADFNSFAVFKLSTEAELPDLHREIEEMVATLTNEETTKFEALGRFKKDGFKISRAHQLLIRAIHQYVSRVVSDVFYAISPKKPKGSLKRQRLFFEESPDLTALTLCLPVDQSTSNFATPESTTESSSDSGSVKHRKCVKKLFASNVLDTKVELLDRIKEKVLEITTILLTNDDIEITEKLGKDGMYTLTCPIEGCTSKMTVKAQQLKDTIKFSIFPLTRHLERKHSLRSMKLVISEQEEQSAQDKDDGELEGELNESEDEIVEVG